MKAKIWTFDPNRLVEQGEEIYQKQLKDKLEPDYRGQIVAIEVDSGDYFLGRNVIEATDKAKAKHPDKYFYVVKVGFRAVHKRR